MCPRDYSLSVDTQSWGICSCWENGGRRSKNGNSATCIPVVPVTVSKNDAACSDTDSVWDTISSPAPENQWCTQSVSSKSKRVCQLHNSTNESDNQTPCEVHQLVPQGS